MCTFENNYCNAHLFTVIIISAILLILIILLSIILNIFIIVIERFILIFVFRFESESTWEIMGMADIWPGMRALNFL